MAKPVDLTEKLSNWKQPQRRTSAHLPRQSSVRERQLKFDLFTALVCALFLAVALGQLALLVVLG